VESEKPGLLGKKCVDNNLRNIICMDAVTEIFKMIVTAIRQDNAELEVEQDDLMLEKCDTHDSSSTQFFVH
jgi:hypothetical protein